MPTQQRHAEPFELPAFAAAQARSLNVVARHHGCQ